MNASISTSNLSKSFGRTVESAEIVSGIVHLQQPALDAARQWLFRPFAVMGEARPVETEFALGVNWFVP